ncbi:OmpL47-type beta-barrel domain-containing protein [Priestia abyssalis]|uniref:OmpL47-type beta-barrel domain-containing protein n=1 Tax=Priestia abyssalis TaxID=1221450 RepID=UPI0011166936|nr:hypothetical protein [Priestia abyssalis]
MKWDAIYGASKYRIYKLDGDQKELLAETSDSYWYNPRMKEGTYTFAVTAVKGTNESALASSVKVEIVYPEIQAPSGLTSTIRNGNDLTLSWQAAEYATSYNIYIVNNNEKKLISTTTNTSQYFPRVAEGNYVYEVSTVSSRFGESTNTNQVTVSIIYPKIQAPPGLTSTIRNGNDLTLSWQALEYATSYNVYQIIGNERKLIATTTNLSQYFPRVAEGNYVYEVSTVSNRFGESTSTSQITVSIVYPEIQAPTGLKSTIRNGNDLTLSWQVAEYATSYNVYQVSGNEKKLVGTTTETSQYFPRLAEGNYIYEISTVSNRFGESTNSSQITVSIIHPKIQAPTGLKSTIRNGNDLTLSWQAAEYATSYNVYQVSGNEKKLINTTKETSQYFPKLAEGDYVYEVSTVSNRFGESSDKTQTVVSIIYPEVQIPVVQLQLNNRNNVALSWNEVDYANSYNIYKILNGEFVFLNTVNTNSYYVVNLTDGVHEFVVAAVSNRFGESPYSKKVITDVKPELEAPSSAVPSVEGDDLTLTWSTVSGAESYNVYEVVDGELVLVGNVTGTSSIIKDLEAGDHEFRIVPVSDSGVEGAEYTTVTVEAEKFTSPLEAPVVKEPVVEGDDVTVSWEPVTNAESYNVYKVVNGELVLVENTRETSITVENLEAGDYEFRVVPVTSSGEEGEKYGTVNVEAEQFDIEPPVTTSNLSTEWHKGEVTAELTATDNLSGVAQTFYSVNGSEFAEGTTFMVKEKGINKVSFYSVDKAGNVEEAKTVEVKIDNTVPETVSNVSDKWYQGEVAVELRAIDDLSGVAQTLYSVNGSQFAEGTTFTVKKEGINKVSFYSVDKAGNVEEAKTVEVKIDNTTPETVSNVSDKWYQGEVTVELTATDNLSGVAQTFYSVNGSEFVEVTAFTVKEEGINKVSFYSIDYAGNVEEAKTVEVKVDVNGPETASNVSDKWYQGEVNVELTTTDDLSGVAKTFYSVNSSEFVEGTVFTVKEEGINKVSFYSVDNAGNVEEAKTVEVKIDKTAPAISWDLVDEYELDSKLIVSYDAKDDLSRIVVETLTINGEEVAKGAAFSLDQPGHYDVKLVVTDEAGWTTTLEKTVTVYIPGNLEILPKVIKDNKGVFTVKVNLPKGFDTSFDLSSVTLNGVSAISKSNGSEQMAKKGQFKFNREDFDWKPGEVKVEFRGMVNGQLVVGYTTVIVK